MADADNSLCSIVVTSIVTAAATSAISCVRGRRCSSHPHQDQHILVLSNPFLHRLPLLPNSQDSFPVRRGHVEYQAAEFLTHPATDPSDECMDPDLTMYS